MFFMTILTVDWKPDLVNFFSYKSVVMFFMRRAIARLPFVLLLLFLFRSPAFSAEVLIIGDIQYRPVSEIASQIKSSLRAQTNEYAVSEIRGKLGSVVEREGASVVVALGKDAVSEALRLPASIAVVYGLIIVPPDSSRANLGGVYMSTPVSQYVAVVRKFLPKLGKVSVVGSSGLMDPLLDTESGVVQPYRVNSSSNLVNTVNRLNRAHSLLLLPDVNLLSTSVMESVYLFSFRNNIPLLGISEFHVKQGALLALVFDARTVSRQIAEKVKQRLKNRDEDELKDSPPGKFNLYVNVNTARKMGINIPEEMLRRAKKIYP